MAGSVLARLFRWSALAAVVVGLLAGRARAAPAAGAAPLAAADELPRGQLKFRAFGGADGLRNIVINMIVQDGHGLLWIATDDGVYRFDGERFTHFSVGHGLRSTGVTVLGVAPDGEPCVGSSDGLVCWDGARFSQARTRGLPSVPVYAIASFAGKLWVGTEGAGLYVRDHGGTFAPAPGWPGAAAARIRALWAGERELLVGDGATVQVTAGDGVWRGIGDVGLAGDAVIGVLVDRARTLWIRTARHMWRVPAGAPRALDITAGLPPGYDTGNVPLGMAIGPRGQVLVATDHGIATRVRDHWQLIDRSVGLPGSSARTVFVDREGTLWIGAIGLFQLRGRGLIEHHDVESGLPGEVVWTFQRDRRGALWLGTSQCLVHAVEGRWVCLAGTEGRIVRSVAFAPQGGVFVGGAPSDLLYIDAEGRVTSITGFDRPADHNVLALQIDPAGDLWIATSSGLYRLRGAVPGALERVAVPGTQPRDRFASLALIAGRLWTGTAEGLAVLDHGAWRVLGTAAGFRSAYLRYVIPRADGRVCAAYHEAIGVVCFRYDGARASELVHIGPAEGLTTGLAYLLGEDGQGRLWIGTGDGVDVVTPDGTDHFDDSDGLAGNDASATAFLLDPDGSVWLGSTAGASHVLAQDYTGPPRAGRVELVDGRLGDRRIAGAPGPLVVEHDRNALAIGFAPGSLLDARRFEYQIRLAPMEAAWSSTRQREARYAALPPGTYDFAVRARVDAGAWGPSSTLHFTVLPAWWQTRWFLAIALAGGVGVLGAGFTWRQHIALRRRTRQLHARSDAGFRAVIDLMPDLISVHRDGQLIYLNLAMRQLLGVGGALGRGDVRALLERIHPDDRERAVDQLAHARGLDVLVGSDVVELRFVGADGTWRICEVSAILVEIGGALMVVASGRDVTERKRMRAKLLVSDRMASLGTLAAGIAHEINNPLSYVTGNLEAMAETLQAVRAAPTAADCDELIGVVGDARDGAERVRKIVHGLRSFSRSADEEQRVPLALPGVLEAAIRLAGNELRHRARLIRELGPVPPVIADDGRLTQVFLNLLVNAAQAIPDGRSDDNQVIVRTRRDEHGRAVVEIADTGRGIPPEVQSRVFDPFFTTKAVGEGTGLGLAICHGIVTGLGGQISIESPAAAADGRPAVATVVRVVLPAAPEPAALAPTAPVPARAPAAEQRRPRVMLIDDEPLVVQTLERLLRRDYDVTIAQCGREALAHIARGARFDALVSDVMMPNMTGIELIEELQRVAPDQAQRLVFLSGGAFTAQTRERLDELGVPQLEKPVSASELRAGVRRVIADAARRPADGG